jgi:DNA-binding response OmpR family regulator
VKVLVAEDEPRLASLLEQSLVEVGWEVDLVGDGREAYVAALGETAYDVLLLDWMLPGMEGVTVCRKLREAGVRTPVLMLTARTTVPDRVTGLEAGADDYLLKPFDLDELVARLRALRRNARTSTTNHCGSATWRSTPRRAASIADPPRSSCRPRSSTSSSCSSREPAGWSPASRSSTRSGTATPTCGAT